MGPHKGPACHNSSELRTSTAFQTFSVGCLEGQGGTVLSPGDHLLRCTAPAQTYTLDAHHKTFCLGQGREALPSLINKAHSASFTRCPHNDWFRRGGRTPPHP